MTAIRYSIEPFGPDIVEAYRRLFPEFAAEKSPSLLSWRFEQGPHGTGLFAVARDFKRIIGMIGMAATRLRVGTRSQSAFQAIDTVVDPAYRGRGVFIGLGQAAQSCVDNTGSILWGFPNANAAPGWFGRLGWQNFGAVPFLVRPLCTGYALRKLRPFLGRLDLPLIGTPKGLGRLVERFGDDADALWKGSGAPERVAVDRDSAWLSWRLMDKPGSSYRSIGSYDSANSLEALVSTCILDKHGGRVCYVMEAMSSQAHHSGLAELLRDELALAARQGAEIALAWCPQSAPNRAAYRRAGFLPLPEKLRPVEIHFGASVPKTVGPVSDASKWFVSYLDSDTV